MSSISQHPSPFYKLLEGAVRRTLVYPVNADGQGPFWDKDGTVITFENGDEWDCSIRVVSLGNYKYRLAENPFIDGPTELNWGEEFYASEAASGSLMINKISIPLIYEHKSTVSERQMTLDDPLAQYIHARGGGWEAIAGGYLVMSIPICNLEVKGNVQK
jgi:hypothetical protein